MAFQLTLTLEYQTETQWRWVLTDAGGRFLADHEVALDPGEPVYESFVDLPGRLRFYENVRPAEDVLSELGAWAGAKVFGAVGEKLLTYERSPACVVQVRVPPAGQDLLFRPFELAHLGGKPLAERGLRLIYTVARESGRESARAAFGGDESAETLRMLGVFSLPRNATPLNLRQERYRLQQLVRRFVRMGGKAVELRLLQYGATRQLLADVLEEAPGWDVLHFSGHGMEGELVLEKPDGTADRIDAEELAELLRPAGARLKLLTLSACYSGAADLRAARAQVGLENPPVRAAAAEQTANVLPSLGQRLAEELDCAVLAMRYPVLDDFATELCLTLYELLLEKKQPLPQALQLALADALSPEKRPYRPAFSRLTPLLFGARAADLRLQAPPRTASFVLPQTGLFHFPTLPERFVGRLMPMLHAGQTLAPESGKTGVLFYGMAGAGKTACALELAYGYDRQNLERFTAFVWHKAPEENHDIADALTNFALSLENQLPGLELVGLMDDPKDFQRKALPRLRGLMEDYAILLVLDNIEGLLTPRGDWRDSRWGELLKVLLGHDGLSRIVLTSRRVPAALADHARLQADSIHALSFQESVILARQLPQLSQLFKGGDGLDKLQRILRAAQGHPKLLELADALAADPAALEAQLARDESSGAAADATRMAFFDTGHSDRPEDVFVRELRSWTDGVAQNLSPTARLLSQFLARLEDADRTLDISRAVWENFLRRLAGERGEDEQQPAPEPTLSQARAALGETDFGLTNGLGELAQAGLIEIETITSQGIQLTSQSLQTLLPILAAQNPEVAALLDDPQGFDMQLLMPYIQAAFNNPTDPTLQAWLTAQQPTTDQQFRLHPGVAEAILRSSPPAVPNAVDIEVGNYFGSMWQQGIKTEMQGGGPLVVEGARRAAPYFLRSQRWDEAAFLLEWMIQRDTRPETLALAIPLLRLIAEKTRDTERGSIDAGLLATALRAAGRYAEAEAALREVIDRLLSQGDYRLAATGASELSNLLRATGRLDEALRTAEEGAEYTSRANLGPWSQLTVETQRLQVLNALGRYDEVLTAVERLHTQMNALPLEGEGEETAQPWNVREVLLNTGFVAALQSEQWETALRFNAESITYKRQRGADEVDIARERFNAYGPLLRLRRLDEARAVLEACRAVFERTGEISVLGNVYSAFADLENAEQRPGSAASFEQTALRFLYQAGRPADCAISHHNLSNYLGSADPGATDRELAHRLAAAIIYVQTSSGGLASTVRNLANSTLPPDPPSFEQVCSVVEQVEGVRFLELFARLPKRAPDGDAAIQMVWEMAKGEAVRLSAKRAQVEATLAGLPEAVREALLSGDEEAFVAALSQLPPEELQAVMTTLGAGVGAEESEQEVRRQMQEVLNGFEPFLQAVAAEARGGDPQARAEIEEVLQQVEEKGWRIADAVRRIWEGQRDAEVLTAELDEQDAALVRRVLELVDAL